VAGQIAGLIHDIKPVKNIEETVAELKNTEELPKHFQVEE
jgi:hypothetical protein